MPHCSAFVLTFVLAATVRAIPVDEISTRNDIGGQADGGPLLAAASNCTGSSTDCSMSVLSGIPLLKVPSENAGNPATLTGLSAAFEIDKIPGDSSPSGVAGETPKDNHLALIKLDSDSIGQGGGTSNRNSSELVI